MIANAIRIDNFLLIYRMFLLFFMVRPSSVISVTKSEAFAKVVAAPLTATGLIPTPLTGLCSLLI